MVRFGTVLVCGALSIYGVLGLLGLFVAHHARSLDRQIDTWISGHRVDTWVSVMHTVTQVGNPWTAWGAAGAAAACLAVSWRRARWLPPLILALLIVVDRVLTLALQHTVNRAAPPHAQAYAWPSGGVGRVIVFYGLIAYLVWSESSGRRRAGIWAVAGVAMLAFSEAYSRLYLQLHWFTDIPGGLLYGGLLLLCFVVFVRVMAELGTAPASPSRSMQPADASVGVAQHPREPPVSTALSLVRKRRSLRGADLGPES